MKPIQGMSPTRGLQAVLLLALPLAFRGDQDGLERIAKLSHGPLNEVSGLARSSQPGIFWVHNDSGDEARLFAIRLDGEVVVPTHLVKRYEDRVWPGLTLLGASNVDWEDLATDGDHLYVADTGNNGNARRDLGVYELAEPNPLAIDRARPLRFLPIRYPDQHAFPPEEWHFDCEAMFVADGRLHFLTKHRERGGINGWASGTKLYRLDTEWTDRDNVLTLVSERADVSTPTAADLSPDGRRLAVLTFSAIWIFERPEEGDDWLGGPTRRLALDRDEVDVNEALCWADDATLLIANEDRDLYRVGLAAFVAVD